MRMEYCGPIGLPHSKFLMWSEEDQDAAIAWTLHKGQRCTQCGTFPDEWLDDEGQQVWPPPYAAGAEHCLGCESLDEYRKQLPDDRVMQYRLHLRPWRSQEHTPQDEYPELDA